MKTFYTILIVMSFLSGNAQDSDSIGEKIENIIKLKHAYEASLELAKFDPPSWNISREVYKKAGAGNVDTTFAAYIKEIALIKANKRQYSQYLENMISNRDSLRLIEKFVIYDYESPLSSLSKKSNILTKLSYYKIFKHFIFDLNKESLPSLADVIEYTKEKKEN